MTTDLPTTFDLDIQGNFNYYFDELKDKPDFHHIVSTLQTKFEQDLSNYNPILFLYNAMFEAALDGDNMADCKVLLNQLNNDLNIDSPPYIFSINQYFSPFMVNYQYDMLSRNSDFNIQFFPPSVIETAAMTDYICQGLDTIQDIDPPQFNDITQFIKNFIIVKSDTLKAGSTFDAFGFIYMSVFPQDKDAFDALDYIIHETAHHYIYALSTIDELVINDFEERFDSPIRKDPRPMLGLFHAAYVLAKLIHFFEKMINRPDLHTFDLKRVTDRLELYRYQYQEGLAIIEQQGQLTEMGQAVMLASRKLTGL